VKINEPFLEEGLGRLEKTRAWSPRVISKLEAHIRAADDEALLRINPIRFALEKDIGEQESIDLFLHASFGGLFSTDWSLTCPTCAEVVESFKTLRNIHASFGCNLCRTTLETTLDEMIHVSFTVSPRVREIAYHYPELLSAAEYYLKYRFDQRAHYADGTRFVQRLRRDAYFFETVPAGRTATFVVDPSPGWLIIADLENDAGCFFEVRGPAERANAPVRLELHKGARLTEGAPRAVGKLGIEVANMMAEPSRVFGIWEPPESVPPLQFDHVLTGKRILTTQTFRELFRNEVVSTTEGIAVRDITILFTDLKGSTALYDRIDDLQAFNLVRQHFDSLGKVILANNGAIVKTIGDAIMASFLSPLDAIRAGLGMLDEIEQFSRNLARRELVLKIGIHRGATIAVTLNERLDYFGQMVNVASRIQGLADADQICVTQEIYDAEGVREALRDRAVLQESSNLKGVSEATVVYRVKPREMAPAAP